MRQIRYMSLDSASLSSRAVGRLLKILLPASRNMFMAGKCSNGGVNSLGEIYELQRTGKSSKYKLFFF